MPQVGCSPKLVASPPVFRNSLAARAAMVRRDVHTRLSTGYQRSLLAGLAGEHILAASLGLDESAANALLVGLLQEAYKRDISSNLARHAVLAMQYRHRRLNGELLTEPRHPMPVLILTALTTLARLYGFNSTGDVARHWWCLASCAEVAYSAMIRPGEAFALSQRLVALPLDQLTGLSGQIAVLVVEKAKNKRALGHRRFTVLRHPGAVAWLQHLMREAEPSMKLRPMGPARFRRASALPGLQT